MYVGRVQQEPASHRTSPFHRPRCSYRNYRLLPGYRILLQPEQCWTSVRSKNDDFVHIQRGDSLCSDEKRKNREVVGDSVL